MGMLSDPLSNLGFFSVVRFYARPRARTDQFCCFWRLWDSDRLEASSSPRFTVSRRSWRATRLLLRSGLVAVQHPTHHGRIIPIEKTDAEEETPQAAEVSGEYVVLEPERIGPGHTGMHVIDLYRTELANTVSNWPSLRGLVIPDY